MTLTHKKKKRKEKEKGDSLSGCLDAVYIYLKAHGVLKLVWIILLALQSKQNFLSYNTLEHPYEKAEC